VIVAFWYSNILAISLFALIAVLMVVEFTSLCRIDGALKVTMLLLALFVSGGAALPTVFPKDTLLFGGILAAFCMASLVYARTGDRFAALFGGLILASVFSGASLLALPEGRFLVLALALVVASCDIAAFFVGRTIGGPRLAPKISPNKTISGGVGGICAALLATMILGGKTGFGDWWPAQLVSRDISPILIGLTGVTLGGLAQIGDLFESHLKRWAGVKDSGRIIPGHGGVLDRFDGYLLTMPVLYLLFTL